MARDTPLAKKCVRTTRIVVVACELVARRERGRGGPSCSNCSEKKKKNQRFVGRERGLHASQCEGTGTRWRRRPGRIRSVIVPDSLGGKREH